MLTPVEKDNQLKALGFKGKTLINAESAVRRLEHSVRTSGEASAYCLYSRATGNQPLMSKRTAEKFRDAFNRGDLDFLRERIGEDGSRPPHQQGESSVKNPGLSTNRANPTIRTALDPQNYKWPEYTASDLAELFNVNGIPAVLLGLEMAKNQGNTMVPKFIERLFDTKERYSEMPASWRASVAGFPLIAEAINAPALEALTDVIELTHPYLGSKLRRDYHKRARPILRTVWGQISRWAAPSGYLLTPRVKTSPIRLETWDEWLTHQPSEAEMRTTKKAIEDALEKGKTVLLRDIQGTPSRVEETPEGLILDIVSRLPDVDRQHGKVFGRRLSFTAVLMSWCQINSDAYERYRASHSDILHERDQEKKEE